MIKNYFKIAWRNIIRNKVNSLLNIAGLAIGLVCVVLIVLYVKNELGYDQFFKDADRIYRLNMHTKMGNYEGTAGQTPPPAGAALLNNFPAIESYTRIYQTGDEIVYCQNGNEKIAFTEKNILAVDSNFLQVFSYQLAEGDATRCLKGPNSMVITQSIAKKYFCNAEAMGKLVVFDSYSKPFVVTGVLKDLPAQSSLQFDILQNTQSCPPVQKFSWSWIWLQMVTYVKFRNGVPHNAADIKNLEAKFPAMIKVQAAAAFKRIGQPYDEFIKKGGIWQLTLQPIADVHLRSAGIGTSYFEQGDIKFIYIFSAIGLFILLLACANFINLSTAQASKRAKEVGLRKVLGSQKGQLVRQFLAEAVLFSLIAGAIAILLVFVSLPAFNGLSGKHLTSSTLLQDGTWFYLLLLCVTTGLLSGCYPAFYLTLFNPVTVLKGDSFIKTNLSAVVLRNGMVIFQFFIATTLIICTVVVFMQLRYSQTKDLGLAKENVVVIANADRLGAGEETLREQLSRLPEVAQATISTSVPTRNTFGDFYVPEPGGREEHAVKDIGLSSFMVDEYFVPALKIQLLKGRNFNRGFNDSTSVILNESAVSQIGWKNPLGKFITYPGNNYQRFQVIGVVKDFNLSSLHDTVGAFALFHTSSKTYHANTSFISVRIKPGDVAQTIDKLQNQWKSYTSTVPFEYSFLDNEFDALYSADQRMSAIFTLFTTISIFVACMGLFGLATYTAQRRKKEIGIRKVLGASMSTIVGMLSADLVKLVVIASFIAFPIAWYLMQKWLEDFAYRIHIQWWVFAITGGLAVLIAMLTVSFQSVKAALANPVKSLRSE